MILKIQDIIVLEEAAADMEQGRIFYDRREPGIGDYFFDSLIADFESLIIHAEVHRKQYGFYRMFSKRFPFAIYDENNEQSLNLYEKKV